MTVAIAFCDCPAQVKSKGPVLIRDKEAYGPLLPGRDDTELEQYTWALPIAGSDHHWRTAWYLWDANLLHWLTLAGKFETANESTLRKADVFKEDSDYEVCSPEQYGLAKIRKLPTADEENNNTFHR